MLEAGWLLLLLFLGVCSLIVVALLWPSFRRAHQTVDEAHTFTSTKAPFTPISTVLTLPELPEKASAQAVKSLSPREWLTIVNDQPDDAPHTLIIGSSGSGKTTMAQAIIA